MQDFYRSQTYIIGTSFMKELSLNQLQKLTEIYLLNILHTFN